MLKYDVAISFAGEDRRVAKQLASILSKKYKVLVFYDDYEQAKLLGKNLAPYLIEIYKDRSSYCIVLVSAAYKQKRWTSHEWKAAQARAFEDPDSDYILPVKLDDTELPGLLPTLAYIDLRKLGPKKVAETIHEKIKVASAINETIRAADRLYQKYLLDEALRKIDGPKFDKVIEALRIRADVYGKKGKYDKAIESLKEIVRQLPRDFNSHLLLGIFYYRTSQFKESVSHYEEADRIAPGHPTIASDLPAARRLLAKRPLRRFTGSVSSKPSRVRTRK